MTHIERCPICGDFDIGDWCNHCNVPTKQEPTTKLTHNEEKQAEDYFGNNIHDTQER